MHIVICLTPDTWAIQPSLSWSKWNMNEICSLNIHLWIHSRYTTKRFIEICHLMQKSPFYELKKIFQKRLCAWRNFKTVFFRPLFIIFRTKILISGLYSILIGQMIVEFLITACWWLRSFNWFSKFLTVVNSNLI